MSDTDSDSSSESDSHRARPVGLNHVALEVGDVVEAREFYGALFEFDLWGRTDRSIFLDTGDQFLALTEADDAGAERDGHRHFGLVVDDPAAVERRLVDLEDSGAERLDVEGVEFRDPWGNRVQLVEYGEIQFTKADHVLRGMGLSDLEKSDDALAELAEKGMAPE